jgi:3-phosphoshikimate 1-carboxyvinyltransferase
MSMPKAGSKKSSETLDLPGLLSARGNVRLPGSKSISNRVLLLAALAEGETEVRDLLESDDTARMLDALRTLGVSVIGDGDGGVRIRGCGGRFPVRDADLFLGNAGTAFRPLTAALALSPGIGGMSGGSYRLTGVARMHERPIGDLVDGLRQLGCMVEYLGQAGYPPLRLGPASIAAVGDLRVRGDVSSQFLTGLLMALPLTGQRVSVVVEGELISKPYIEITLAMMRRFGVEVAREGWSRFTIEAGSAYHSPGTVYIEGDASSASYFLAAGAIAGGPVRVEGVGAGSVQGDVRFAEALGRFGARMSMGPNWIEAQGPDGGRLQGQTLDCNHIPDAAMTLAVVALFAAGPTRLNNVGSWRVKETDRIAAMATELRKIGARVEEGPDWLEVAPPAQFRSAVIDTYDDHRMAMCLSLAALAGVPLRINDPKCVAKTFPEYFSAFAAVTTPVPVIAIDGPSASGKGTVAARVAEALGFAYLDSGALYRITALAARRRGIDWADEAGVAAVAAALAVRFEGEQVLLDGGDVSAAIRDEAMSSGASQVAVLPAVREALLFRQRAFRRTPGVVADGRDMGTVVFPDAGLKVFLTASVEARAERRYKQLIAKGNAVTLAPLLEDLRARDARDSERAVAPLQQGSGALLLDTTALTIDEAVASVLRWWQQRSTAAH